MYVFLTKSQADDLGKRGLGASMESFERDDSEKGFLISKEDLSVFMEAEDIVYEMKGKVFEGIENISFSSSPKAGAAKTVKTRVSGIASTKSASVAPVPTHLDVDAPEGTWDGKGRDKFVAVALDEFKGVLGKVHISVPNGEVEPPLDADYELNIRIWSSPNEKALRGDGRDLKPPEKLFGEAVACRDASFAPLSKGSRQLSDNGFVWGEYVSPNYLYIFFDVCQKDTIASLAIFRAMLKQLIAEVTPEGLRASTLEISKKRDEKQKLELRNFMKTMLSSQFAASKERVGTLTKEIEQLHTNLVLKIRDRDYNMKLFKAFEEDEIDKKIAVMIRDMYQDKNIIGLKIEGNNFKVFTDTLYVTDPRTGWKHELGKFRLELDCPQGQIKVFNLTRQVLAYNGQKMNGPHVFANNTICAGNFVETTAELFGKHDYSNLASTLIVYLESVNTDDSAGKWVHRWPRVNEDGSLTEYDKMNAADKKLLHDKGIE